MAVCLLTLGVAAPWVNAKTPLNGVAAGGVSADAIGGVAPDPREMEEIWDLTFRWYLIWIDAILTDALAELDALEDPSTWMQKVEGSYLANGVPDDLTATEKQDFLDLIGYTQALLLSAPETVPLSSIISFNAALSAMEADAQSQ